MRKILIVLLICLPGIRVALADGMVLPERAGYINIRYHHVTVNVDGNHAVTSIEQEFYNPYNFGITGTYLFPVAPDMIVTDYQATLGDVAQTPRRQDAATTNAILYEMVAQNRDPSLLQYADWETLALDINLPPGGSQQMTIQYEEVLTPESGTYHYRYIMSVERYTVDPLQSVSITVNLADAANVYSSTHPITTSQTEGGTQVQWQDEYVYPSQDFDLFFTQVNDGFGGGFLHGKWDEQDHFLFLFSPDPAADEGNSLPKDIVFVLDRSGSMSGEKIVQAHDALNFILGQLGEQDRFSIVGFDDQIEVFATTLQSVDAERIRAARQFVETLQARNDTNIEAALRTGQDILMNSERRAAASRMIVFLTDGLATAGIVDDASIADLVEARNADTRLHVFGVGYDVNTHLLDRLAADNGGSVTYVQPDQNLEAMLVGFYTQIARPILTNLEVSFEGMTVSELYPQALPDLFQGSSLLFTGRFEALSDHVVVRVTGWVGDEQREYEYPIDLSAADQHDFVPRLWATRRIGHLLDVVRVEGESEALVAEIRELGLRYGLITPYTTFVIAPQSDGAASAANMSLYQDQAALNQGSGQVTIQARVQNQMYQQADQAYMAQGANVVNVGQSNLVQVEAQNIDLALLRDRIDPSQPLTQDWITDNLQPDRVIDFASEEYFALADRPETRQFLQTGLNVVFDYQGEIIMVQSE